MEITTDKEFLKVAEAGEDIFTVIQGLAADGRSLCGNIIELFGENSEFKDTAKENLADYVEDFSTKFLEIVTNIAAEADNAQLFKPDEPLDKKP